MIASLRYNTVIEHGGACGNPQGAGRISGRRIDLSAVLRAVPVLRDADPGRPEQPVADLVARLEHMTDAARGVLRSRHLEHRLMEVRIEALARLRRDFPDSVALEDREKLAFRHLDAL